MSLGLLLIPAVRKKMLEIFLENDETMKMFELLELDRLKIMFEMGAVGIRESMGYGDYNIFS